MFNFDIKKTIEKAVRGAVAGLVAVVSSFLIKNVGLELTPEQQGALIAFLFGLISALTNILKHKFPKVFGWL
jgi:hypothetical protein